MVMLLTSKQYGCLVITSKALGNKSGFQQRLTKVIVGDPGFF